MHLTAKIISVMKFTAFLCLVACLHASAAGRAQNVTLSEKNVPLKKIFRELNRQTGFEFLYKDDFLRNAIPVSIHVNNEPIENVLEKCFTSQPLAFEIINKTIVVKPVVNKVLSISRTPNINILPPIMGIVRGPDGQPIANANIIIKGTKKGTTTNADGSFTIEASKGEIIIISSIGFVDKQLSIINNNLDVITLAKSESKLDEVQIIAYGTTTKRLNTGSVNSVKAAEIEKQPVTNVLQALQGNVPGLMIEQGTGLPGGSFSVRIRGQNNISAFKKTFDPLYVIDGIPYNAQLPQNALNASLRNIGNVSALNFINPADIESVEVLKDADATSIYGSRAANGAILITTKKAKAGAMKLDLNFFTGTTRSKRLIDVLNTRQYLEVRREAFKNDNITPGIADYGVNGTWDTTRNTNWVEELEQRPSPFTNIQATVSGGNELNQYLIGGTFSRQATGYPKLIPGDGANQIASVHFNMINSSKNKRLLLTFTGSYQAGKNTVSNVLSNINITTYAPDAPSLYNPDGTLNWAPKVAGQLGTWINPLSAFYQQNKMLTSNLVSKISIAYKVLKGFEVKSDFSYTNIWIDESRLVPTTVFDPARKIASGSAFFQNSSAKTWLAEPQLNYSKQIGKNGLKVLLGTTFQENNNKGQGFSGNGFANNGLLGSLQNASTITKGGGVNTQYKYSALFGRINYNYDDKYVVNMNLRREGSSRFGPGKQFHTFASIGAAYLFTDEAFFKNNIQFLSFGKLRGSYGTTGSDTYADYQYLDLYTVNSFVLPYQGINPLIPQNQYNPDLAWEQTQKMEFGLELGFLKDRVLFEGSYYSNRSGNQLVSSPLPTVTGFTSIAMNLPALVQNTGIEFILTTINVHSKSFKWNSSFNISLNRNKLLQFPALENSTYKNLFIVGKSINIIKAFHYAGVNSETGIYQFIDAEGKLTSNPVNPTDKTQAVDLTPKYFGGFQNTLSYRNFSLSFLFQFVNQVAQNINGAYQSSPGQTANIPSLFLNRWQKPGDQADYQKYFTGTVATPANAAYNAATQSTWAYSSASYVRLKNIFLTWNLPEKAQSKIKLKSTSLFLQGQNLLTITKYKGYDPETRGLNLPPVQILTIGVKTSL
jgi:TonB-dependent starch-binding outer membrane protein SusC